MRLLRSSIGISLIIGTLSVVASFNAQSPVINGPTLGFTPNSAGSTIWPIIGVPGASMLAARLAFDVGIRGAVISPKQDYAVAATTSSTTCAAPGPRCFLAGSNIAAAEDAQVVVLDLTAGTPVVNPVTGTYAGAELFAVSPTGATAAVYNGSSKTVQIIGGLPHSPAIIQQFDASAIPGRGSAMAVSDDGTIALVLFVDASNAGLWVMRQSGVPSRLSLDHPSAAAFFPNRQDAVVADATTQSAFTMMDIGHAAAPVPLISADSANSFSSVSVAEDGQRVFLAGANSGLITIVDTQTRTPVSISCQCRPTGFYRLNGTSIFRLNEPSLGPVMVLDASSSTPRIVIIPPVTSAVARAR